MMFYYMLMKILYFLIKKKGGIAQSVERVLCKHEAPGSKPGISNLFYIYIYIYKSCISLVVRTPRCGRGDPGSNPGCDIFFYFKSYSELGLVVKTSVSHTEGPEFNPRSSYFFIYK